MAGLRGQDEIDKAFADLEYIPGSKKKRREGTQRFLVVRREKQTVGMQTQLSNA